MLLEGLQDRLAALHGTTTQLRDLIDQLANLRFDADPSTLGCDEGESASADLGAEIGQLLRSGLEEQELLQEEVKYVKPEGPDKARLRDGVERLGGDLISYRAAFRKARLAAKKGLERVHREEREVLLKSLALPDGDTASSPAGQEDATPPRSRRSMRHSQQHQHDQSSLSQDDQKMVGASSNVTDALRRTHDLIAAELSRSEFAHQTLMESTTTLKQLNESYSSLDTMLASSRDLLGTLLRSQKSDTWYLQTALYMLLATGAWLVFRRFLYGPTWWLIWLPIRTVFRIGTKAGGAVTHGLGGAAESSDRSLAGGGRPSSVQGLPKDEIPTIRVQNKTPETTQTTSEPKSMVEKVIRIVEGEDDSKKASPPRSHTATSSSTVEGEDDSKKVSPSRSYTTTSTITVKGKADNKKASSSRSYTATSTTTITLSGHAESGKERHRKQEEGQTKASMPQESKTREIEGEKNTKKRMWEEPLPDEASAKKKDEL